MSIIKNHLLQKEDFDSKFRFLIQIGENDKAREILINHILADRKIFSLNNINADKKTKMCFNSYGEELKAVGLENPFQEENY